MHLLSAALATFVVSSRGDAQVVQGSIRLDGGSATDVLGVGSRAMSLSPSVTITANQRASLMLGASGTRFDNGAWSAGGSASAALRAPITRWLDGTLNGDGAMTKTSYPLSYGTAGVLPALEATAGAVTGYVGTRVVEGVATGVTRTSLGGLAGGSVRVSGGGGETMIVGARIERARIDSVSQLDRTATLALYRGALSVSGSVALRTELASRVTFGNVGASLAVTPSMSLELAGGTYPTNRLVGTPAGRFMNIGASLRTGSTHPHPPEVAGVPVAAAGMTRLTMDADDALRVDVSGDFTNWQPIAAHRAANGVWYIDLKIPPGQYRYAFRVNGTRWVVPAGAAVVDDDFGGKAAWLTVSAPNSPAR